MLQQYLIFGGTGSLGKKLIEHFFSCDDFVTVYSRDEAKHWTIKNEFADHPNKRLLKFIVGDIRDKQRVNDAIDIVNPHTIIIAAALKQVDTCELSPSESIATNVTGTQNIVSVVQNKASMIGTKMPLENVLFVSSDKACSPVNTYGMCKAISERIITSAASMNTNLRFMCVRYGNVLESRGSIIPLFRYQAEHADFLTVTDLDMTRFLMTLDDSVKLIKATLMHGKNGETWIPKGLLSMKIGDLAELFSEKWYKPIKVIGPRPGEKKHETLLNVTESIRSNDIGTHYVLDPAWHHGPYRLTSEEEFCYSSNDNVLSKQELQKHLNDFINIPIKAFKGLSIEEILTNRKE